MRLKRYTICLIFVTVFVASLAAAGAYAQGVIVPRPCERCPTPRPNPRFQLPSALPIKSITLDTKIREQVATTHVEQVFRNDTDLTLEGTYFFPLPETAAVSEFAIWDGQRRLVGEVRSREEARRIYDEIVRRKRDPGLLEYAGKNLFQASIFPIPPHTDKKLELTYTQALQAEGGTVSYRYPLGTGRYTAPVGLVSGRVELESREPLRNIYSPSHAIDISRGKSGDGSERSVRISFESPSGAEVKDFQLFYARSNDDFGLSLLTHREPGKDGYFLLMLSPKDDLSEAEYAAKDIVFVIDTSGSMEEEGKIEKARAALLFGIKTLRPADRFNVISFSGEEHLMESGLVAADDSGRARGVRFVESLRPTGGTNINDALLAAFRQFDSSARPKMIVFMTDGLPTVGETSLERIVENVRAARAPGVRLFTFGVGYDVNTALLDKLAAENSGAADYIEPKEDLEVKVSNFFTKVNHPVLTDLALDMSGVETDLVYPRNVPDLFRGTQLTLIGRYRNPNDISDLQLRLTGKTNNRMRTFTYDNLRFPLTEEENDFLPRLWATRRVGWLMEQIRTNGEVKELRDEIVDLGTRYGIVTPYTSYLALEPETATDVDNDVTRITAAPLNGRIRRRADVAGNAAPASAPKSVFNATENAPSPALDTRAVTGAGAVQQSKRERAQQEAIRVEASASPNAARNVSGKTFYLRDGVWADAEYKESAGLPKTILTFGTDDYFALLKREPRLAAFFALGERVIVVFKNRVYQVNAASK